MSKHDDYCPMGLDGRFRDMHCDCDFIGLVREDQNERIIKLLEPLGCKANGIEHDCQNGLGYTTAKDLIELIKGETK
jgi:hypothetical protein